MKLSCQRLNVAGAHGIQAGAIAIAALMGVGDRLMTHARQSCCTFVVCCADFRRYHSLVSFVIQLHDRVDQKRTNCRSL